jgi:hypothetical protein
VIDNKDEFVTRDRFNYGTPVHKGNVGHREVAALHHGTAEERVAGGERSKRQR